MCVPVNCVCVTGRSGVCIYFSDECLPIYVLIGLWGTAMVVEEEGWREVAS